LRSGGLGPVICQSGKSLNFSVILRHRSRAVSWAPTPGSHHMSNGQPDKSVTQILQNLREHPELQAELDRFRRDITVLFTDIKGSTAYFDKYGDAAGLAMIHVCNELQAQRVGEHNGRVIKTIGDAVMATFEAPPDAVLAAMEMQEDLVRLNANRAVEDHVSLRIGVHFGAGIVKSNDVFGDVVNVASRIQSAASPDQIVISDGVLQQLDASKFAIRSLGRFAFKGKGGEQDLFEVIWNERGGPAAISGHTIVISSTASDAKFLVQHVRPDGTHGARTEVPQSGLRIGRSEGDLRFPEDDRMAPLHARLAVEGGQMLVTDLSSGRDLMVKVIEPYLLQDRDVIKVGRQVFCFCHAVEAIAVAANAGTTIGQLSSMVLGPVAELQRLNPHGDDLTIRYVINTDVITIGRERGTYTFPDDAFMSRSHAKVYQRGENFFLEDLGSRNGTFVRVHESAPVPNGSSVLIGRQLFSISSL
jgi:class 3 adenylate cyclase/pSer/pThr/pTyr-binding forkhead associated (FHA) protein